MKHSILLPLLAAASLCACQREDTQQPSAPPTTVTVELQVHPEAVRAITRATDETTIRDVNFYLFGADDTPCLHSYGQNSTLRFKCFPGDYTLYVVANIHADMGALTPLQLAAYAVPYKERPADLPMAGRQQVRITAGNGTVTLPAIEVRRRAARIGYTVAVGKEVPDIRLVSVCFCNLPRRSPLFGNGTPPAAAADYRTGYYADIPLSAAARYSGTAYLPENLQGEVASIVSQQDKNRDNAPEHATYLLLRAVRGSKVLDYTVYLGENNTSNFDVRGNTSHTLDITILGDNEVDTRVHGYTLSVWDDLEEDACGGYCPVDPQRSLYIAVEGNKDGIALSGEVEITGGDTACVEFHRIGSGSYFDFEVWKLQGESSYEMSYFPEIVMQDNDLLCYTVTIWDEYGYGQSYDFSHRYANEVKAYVKYGTVENGQGSVTATGALASEQIGSTQNLRVMCSEKGCTLTAAPAAGYRFAGWYADYKFTRLLSERQSYTYVPTWFSASVYAKFERDPSEVYIGTSSVEEVCFASDRGYGIEDIETFVVPYGSRCTISVGDDLFFEGFYDGWNRETATRLTAQTSYTFTATEDRNIVPHYLRVQNLSAAGTANCYIAPKAGAAYSFNARTMGNGRMTTGITPRTLYGSRAEVLWESSAYAGSVRGAVIAAAEYRDGQIRFRTGTEAGNALIGLFDSNDNCIWSWHIWVTAYDPAASAQTYTGGAVFMDRNLGAASITDPGLYYQWGRKEPFGASYTRVTYHEDHPYDITDPMMGYGEMTLAYSIAHPWTFMCGVAMNDDRYEDTSDWLASQNPNLWGNASSATALADAGSKSIYDPCPPGWRVPDRRTFAEAAISKNTGGLSDACYSMRINTSGMCANYSRGGYLMDGTQYNPDKAALVWTNAPAQYQTGVNYYKHYSTALKIYPAAVEPLARISRDMALPVRCVRE